MSNTLDHLQAEEIAKQLRSPNGPLGKEVASRMNDSNKQINHFCIEKITPKRPSSDSKPTHLLEIGPGNGSFLELILQQLQTGHYTGLDWSHDMVDLANTLHDKHIKNNKARFIQGAAHKLPFEQNSFDIILSVNTLYFWPGIHQTLQELSRVLKNGSQIILGFADIAFIESLPFTSYGFQAYKVETVKQAFQSVGFEKIQHTEHKEVGNDNTGGTQQKHFHCLSAHLNK